MQAFVPAGPQIRRNPAINHTGGTYRHLALRKHGYLPGKSLLALKIYAMALLLSHFAFKTGARALLRSHAALEKADPALLPSHVAFANAV